MTLDEAKQSIGRKVVYRPANGGPLEEGVITEVRGRFVFARYGSDQHSKGTRPENLELMAPPRVSP